MYKINAIGEYGDTCVPSLHTKLLDAGHMYICSIIDPDAIEKMMSFPAKFTKSCHDISVK